MHAMLDPTLLALEERLLDPEIRAQPALAAPLLAEDFLEVGASGRRFDKAEILNAITREGTLPPLAIEDFQVVPLGPGAALATYVSVRGQVRAFRSSLWVFRTERWQMLYHQGTLCAQPR